MADIVLSIVLATIAWIIVWLWRRMPKPPGVFEPDTQLVTKPDIKPEAYRNCDPDPKMKSDATVIEAMRKPETSAITPSTLYPKDKDPSNPNHNPATITDEYVHQLESDHLFYQQQIGQFQQKFLALSSIIEGLEKMNEENRSLKEEVECLKQTIFEYDVKKVEDQAHLLQSKQLKNDILALSCNPLKRVKSFTAFESEMPNVKKDVDRSHLSKGKQIKKDIQDLSCRPLKRVKGSKKPVSDQSKINQLQAENRKLKSELESIRHEKESTWKSMESQYLQEIQDLKATIQIQNEMLSSKMMSELDRVNDENDTLNVNLDPLKDSLAGKLIDIDELKSQVLEAENQMSLTEIRNDDLKKSITDSLQANQELIVDRDNAILTALNSAKLADEKVAALSEALSTLQEAATHSKEATSYENTAEHLLKDGPTKTKGNWIGKWLVKHGFKTPKHHQESEQIKLMENTGLWMVESAQNLHEQANE